MGITSLAETMTQMTALDTLGLWPVAASGLADMVTLWLSTCDVAPYVQGHRPVCQTLRNMQGSR